MEVVLVGIFIRLTVLVALGICVLIFLNFLLHVFIPAAIIAALIVGGIFAVNFLRGAGRANRGGPLVRR